MVHSKSFDLFIFGILFKFSLRLGVMLNLMSSFLLDSSDDCHWEGFPTPDHVLLYPKILLNHLI